jgi:Holliday junction resolvase RusA-like endonuclease
MNFTIAMTPVPKARARTVRGKDGGKSHSFTPTKTTTAEVNVRAAFQAAFPQHRAIEDVPLYLEVSVFILPPKSICTKKMMPLLEAEQVYVTKHPDLDNYEKLVMDALNGVAYRDDSLVALKLGSKVYSFSPRLEITILPLRAL